MRRVTRRDVLVGAAATAAVSTIGATTSEASPSLHEISITGFTFEPMNLSVKVGDRIRWINKDLAPHTATAREFGWDTGELALGESAEVTVTKEMETQYFCVFHPHMRGTLMIETGS